MIYDKNEPLILISATNKNYIIYIYIYISLFYFPLLGYNFIGQSNKLALETSNYKLEKTTYFISSNTSTSIIRINTKTLTLFDSQYNVE